MKEGWKEVTIGDLGQVITGNTPPKKDADNYGGSYPFIKPTDMDIDRRYVTSWEENYSEKAFKRYKNSYIPPRATGVVTIGTVGEKMFQADQYCFTNQSVNVVIPSKDYDEDFIFYLLKYNLPKVENANPGTASGRHHVSKSNFCAIKVDVPLLSTQRIISSILSAYDNLIENNLKRIKLLEEKAQLTYEEWFVKMRFPGCETARCDEVTGLPEGWKENTLEFLCEKITDGTHDSPKQVKNGIKLITGKHINDGFINFESAYLISELDHEKIKKRSGLSRGDLLFSNIGTLGSIGVVTEDFEYSCKNVVIFKKKDGFDYFLYCYLSNKNTKNKLDNQAAGVAQKFYSLSFIRGYKDIFPNEILLINFNKIMTPIFKLKYSLHRQNQLLKEERDILLPRLMGGMIDVEELEIKSL